MRAVLAASIAALVLASALAAEARPFPQTEKATRELVKDVLADTDDSAAKMLRDARTLLRTLKDAAPTVPGIPEMPETETGALEIRATLVQPGVRDQDMMLGAMWLGSSAGYWTGVYWVESDDAGQVRPSLMDVNENGLIRTVEGGALAMGSSVNVTYHFLGLDGVHIVHPLGEIPILDEMPVLGRMAVGGAHASSRGAQPEAVFVSPWNLYDHNVTVGLTMLADGSPLVDETITACEDWDAQVMEPGCRLLYILPFDDAATSLQLWRLDADGGRTTEVELSREDLLSGVTFGA